MNSRIGLCFAGLLMAFAPGCCVFEALFGCDHFHGSGYGDSVYDDECGHSRKCAKKCRKCRECLEEHGMAGMGVMGGGYYPEMMYGDFGGDCGCGGGMAAGFPAGGCAGCAGGFDSSVMTTPTMNVPTPAPTPMPTPMPTSGTTLPPPIPPAETSSVPPVPPGTQYVSVEEFQRLPGVVLSGQTTQPATAQMPDVQALASNPTAAVPAAASEAKPLDASVISSAPANARQVQQAAWAPVRK